MEVSELKQKAGLVPYQRRLKLEKVGSGFAALCKWHPDHNPSLSVYKADTGDFRWKCFDCVDKHKKLDIQGDVITLVMKADGVDFKTALATVKKECGITDEFVEIRFDQATAAAQLDKVADFLTSRGISLDLARDCGIGYFEYPGAGPCVSMPYGGGVVKFRALNAADKINKWRHLSKKPSAELLFGMDVLDDSDFLFEPEIWVTESELDSLTMRSHGFPAISVSSATTCTDNKTGKLKIKPELLAQLENADRIFLAMDQDEAGNLCAAAFEKTFPSYKIFRIAWKYEKGGTEPKDVGELYCAAPDGFKERIKALRAEVLAKPPAWRELFKSRDQMEQGDIKFLIKDFLTEGVSMLGALSGSGKTWFALSMAKALTTGKKFLGRFEVTEPMNVLYLVPENGERAFRTRLDKMGINKRFLCRTMKDGVPLKLDDPLLMAAIRDLKPVVILDTAVRFAIGEENNASDNARGLANGIFQLLQAGAPAVIGLHHQAKGAADKFPSLENSLRGSSDIGAMCDAVYNLKCVNPDTTEIRVTCVKPRDFEPVSPFHIQGKPFIDEEGDFAMLLEPSLPKGQANVQSLIEAIKANPRATYRELEEQSGITISRLSKMAAKAGWKKAGDTWIQQAA